MKTVDTNKISKQIIEIFSNEGITINMARDILTQVDGNLDNQRVNIKPFYTGNLIASVNVNVDVDKLIEQTIEKLNIKVGRRNISISN